MQRYSGAFHDIPISPAFLQFIHEHYEYNEESVPDDPANPPKDFPPVLNPSQATLDAVAALMEGWDEC